MSSHTIPELEALIADLPPTDQLRLLEDLARRLRTRLAGTEQPEREPFDSGLAAMARDRSVQAELQAIDREFRETESDGLTRD